ncbi:hypothetical protein RJ639_027845 [Escallonia herrerae]|uniref:Uncharacterized protein n=1 Tax=Escallonia herrerae TaxID=1293975 RepID=A0AA88X641_9ASTE|nr:hypothetical protein RJ639_027845 [Escallonia herrerae]
MASIFSMAGAGLSALRSPAEGRFGAHSSPSPPFAARPRRMVVAVKAEAINPEIRKTEDKVVDSVVMQSASRFLRSCDIARDILGCITLPVCTNKLCTTPTVQLLELQKHFDGKIYPIKLILKLGIDDRWEGSTTSLIGMPAQGFPSKHFCLGGELLLTIHTSDAVRHLPNDLLFYPPFTPLLTLAKGKIKSPGISVVMQRGKNGVYAKQLTMAQHGWEIREVEAEDITCTFETEIHERQNSLFDSLVST